MNSLTEETHSQTSPDERRFAPQVQADDRFSTALDTLRRYREMMGERQPDYTIRDPDRGQWIKSGPLQRTPSKPR